MTRYARLLRQFLLRPAVPAPPAPILFRENHAILSFSLRQRRFVPNLSKTRGCRQASALDNCARGGCEGRFFRAGRGFPYQHNRCRRRKSIGTVLSLRQALRAGKKWPIMVWKPFPVQAGRRDGRMHEKLPLHIRVGDGWTNLGTDEWFLEHIAPDEMALYFYINDNAVILGRKPEPLGRVRPCRHGARPCAARAPHQPAAARVYHDRGNLNFSFIAGSERYDQDRQLRLILGAVRALGIPCEATGRNDLAVEGRKFSGNAFCKRSKVKQHTARCWSLPIWISCRNTCASIRASCAPRHKVRARPRLQFERLSARPARGSAA